MSLFRKEAVSHQSERLTGSITLAQPMSIKLTVLTLVSIAVLIVTFLFSAEYSRKETVRGFLMPSKGMVKAYADQGGIVEQIHVDDGDSVKKGQVLATILLPRSNSQGVHLSAELKTQLQQQQIILEDEIQQNKSIEEQELKNLAANKKGLKKERWALKTQYKLADENLALLEQQHKDLKKLNKQGFVSSTQQEQHYQAILEARQDKQNLARLLLQQENELSNVAFNLQNVPKQTALRINILKRELADINQQLAQVENSHKYTVHAATDGRITGIQSFTGENITTSKPLLYILPEGAELVAELLLPTRSAGFIEKGLVSRLRFDAFPYQRFGFIESEITRIDKALTAPNEVQLPVALQEPVYRLQASLSEQQMKAYGQKFELKSGMLFEADIMLEQRTLIEWLLEPIYSLNGRVS